MKSGLISAVALAVALCWGTTANATGWGIGVFGGINAPIAQEDAEKGTVYGAHLRLSLGGLLTVEPNFMLFTNGDYEIDESPGETFEGASLYKFGVNLLLGGGPSAGIHPYLFGGVGYYNRKIELPDLSDSRVGWNGGIGFEFGGGPIGFDIRGSFELMPLDGDGSRKWVHVRGGINYYFGVL